MPTVFVVQNQMRFDTALGQLVPKYPKLEEQAAQHGSIKYLLSPSAAPWNPKPILEDLDRGLTGYRNEDSLLLIGNPVLIGWAVTIAASWNNGFVKTLQWNGKDRAYIPVSAQIFPRDLGGGDSVGSES